MSLYIITGHGATQTNRPEIKLNPNQLVIYPVLCGHASPIWNKLPIELKNVLLNPTRINRGKNKKLPIEFKWLTSQKTGKMIPNQIINTTLPRPSGNPEQNRVMRGYHARSGMFKFNPKTKNFNYIEGKNQKLFLSNLIKNKTGTFYVEACRVKTNVNQAEANRMTRALSRGETPKINNQRIQNIQKREARPRVGQQRKNIQIVNLKTGNIRYTNLNPPKTPLGIKKSIHK